MAKNFKFMGPLATILVVMGLMMFITSGGAAAPQATVSVDTATYTPKPGYYQWRTVGRNPMWTSRDGRKGVSNPEDFIEMMTSAKGRKCAQLSGLPASVWSKATLKVRQGKYKRYAAKPGTAYASMCSGVGNVSVIRDVQWAGEGPLKGRRIVVDVPYPNGNVVRYILDVPDGCANVTVTIVIVERAPAPKPKPGPKPKPKPMAPVTIVKVAEDAAGHVIATPTNTFYFTVTTTGKVTSVRYDQHPQPAGRCRVGSIVLVWEDVPNRWELFSPRNNPQTFVCQKGKGVRAVFKNRQVGAPQPQPPPAPPAPPPPAPPAPPPPAPPPPPPTVTYSKWCKGSLTENKSNTEIRWTGGWTSSTGENRTTVSFTIDYPGQYNTTVSESMTIAFPNGNSVLCTAKAKTGNPPFQP